MDATRGRNAALTISYLFILTGTGLIESIYHYNLPPLLLSSTMHGNKLSCDMKGDVLVFAENNIEEKRINKAGGLIDQRKSGGDTYIY